VSSSSSLQDSLMSVSLDSFLFVSMSSLLITPDVLSLSLDDFRTMSFSCAMALASVGSDVILSLLANTLINALAAVVAELVALSDSFELVFPFGLDAASFDVVLLLCPESVGVM
jgi:hypothetical protein